MSHFASFNAMKPSMLQNADRCVFVGDLSFFCTELDLAEAFKHCGTISRLEVKRGRHGDSLLYAFVEFHESIHAQIAIRETHGAKLLGRRMKVNWTDCKPAATPGADQWVQVHVNFVSRDLVLKISEEFLESVFIQFGNIGDIIVKRHSCSNTPAVVSGYAFIYFIDAYAAFRAIHGCKGINMEGLHFECALSRQYENAMSSQHGPVPRGFKKPVQQQQMLHAHPTFPSQAPYHQYMEYAPRENQFLPPAHIHQNGVASRRMPPNHSASSVYPIESTHRHYHNASNYPPRGYGYHDVPYGQGGRSPSMVATSFPEENVHYKPLHSSTSYPIDDRHFAGLNSLKDPFAHPEFLKPSFFSQTGQEDMQESKKNIPSLSSLLSEDGFSLDSSPFATEAM